ncbi:MAG: DUF2330 domain-containing protein [Candidatus Parabeggiatoa sp. nov. 1]|nr:MAG: DUF2330 domain-containing protein [Gammaproteobacteria bacterium]
MNFRFFVFLAVLLSITFTARVAYSFCGFYVAKADAKLFNKTSQVVLVRSDDKTVITMANDFKGDLKEFAVVIPVPAVLEKNQIHIGDKKVIDHLDAYTAPRLVEYLDENPCQPKVLDDIAPTNRAKRDVQSIKEKSHSVTVESQYTVGEYDIVILSATESDGLSNWLKENGYRIPNGAAEVLGSYIKQNMRFLVAKVNLEEQSKLGFSYLRPISIAFESPKFMLPIRLGMVNADGAQELFIYTLTKKGRVETTNYRTVRLPTNRELPVYIKDEFADFYRAMFEHQVKQERMETVFLEYAWDMNWCDPCAAEPLSVEELRSLGVFWLDDSANNGGFKKPARDVFVTRLHVRYDAKNFPEDLRFRETAFRSNFQGRYILRQPWTGNDNCPAAREYERQLKKRLEDEAQRLALLTGWDINPILEKMGISTTESDEMPWWQKLWEK